MAALEGPYAPWLVAVQLTGLISHDVEDETNVQA